VDVVPGEDAAGEALNNPAGRLSDQPNSPRCSSSLTATAVRPRFNLCLLPTLCLQMSPIMKLMTTPRRPCAWMWAACPSASQSPW
jgi:hypothetical protein